MVSSETATRTGAVIVEAESVTKTFTTPDGHALPVLDGVSFTLSEGEIVALLGKSGSGKSTLLRCVAGLIAPSSGSVSYRGTPLTGANPGVSMVFQTFALLPWLTVQQNVELGLEARGVAGAERAERALRAIDLIGLDGFESAYPKELSGGMRQRVGFARAIVTEPDALLMDEPFSALDVLTAENLRGELVKLWEGHGAPIKSILIVTHNIEEAVLLADRVLVLSSNPGRIRAELTVELPRPRDRHGPRFEALVDTIYGILTGREQAAADALEAEAAAQAAPGPAVQPMATPINTPLPDVSPGGLSGLLEILAARGGRDGLAEIADDLSFEIDDLLPLTDAAVMLDARPHRRLGHRDHRRGQGVRRRGHPHQQAAVRQARRQARAPCPHHHSGPRRHRGPHPARSGSSSTSSVAASRSARRAASSTPPSTGAATPSSTTTTATTKSSPSNPAPRNTSDPRDACWARQPSRCGLGVRGSKARSA